MYLYYDKWKIIEETFYVLSAMLANILCAFVQYTDTKGNECQYYVISFLKVCIVVK